MNKNSAKRGVFVDLLYFWARVIKYPETLSTYSGKERIMGIDMELVTGWYLREPGVIFERKDQRAPQAFFSGEQEGRFFVSTPIFGVRENAAGRITYVRGIKPANGLKKFPFEFPVIIYCFASTGKVFFQAGKQFKDGRLVPDELRNIRFSATVCDNC